MGHQGGKLAIYLVLVTCILVVITLIPSTHSSEATISSEEKRQLRNKALEMFNHAYNSYMTHAYPADELMPLSCKGRFRGTEPFRGDIDDTLGNFTLTLIDTLDTLAVLGKLAEFDRAVRLVIRDAKFDADVIVSVFETNIRVLGGLLGGHVAAVFFKQRGLGMEWYNNELLAQAKEVGDRLLPAFNTSTGIPYPRINMKHGITPKLASSTRDTCTSCAGTMILEFAALSRLTGIAVYEEKTHKAMNYLWTQRHRTSDLMGTVINLHNGDWIRRESGVGAGIDSYYEYVLKAYVLLGDETYLARFNKHYDAVKRYIHQGPLLVDVHMHKPTSTSRNFMDALLAFWPGLQVLIGDIGSAVEIHEMLYQVIQRHNFLPEAFTTDFRVHWGQHPLRPEFLESTYFLYEATADPYYLEVGKKVMDNLEKHARVGCGFAAIKDLKKGTLEDQMDSYVLAETFKYLFLLFSEKDELLMDMDSFVFTTEAHLLPLKLSVGNYSWKTPPKMNRDIHTFDMMSVAEMTKAMEEEEDMVEHDEDINDVSPTQGVCHNYHITIPDSHSYAHSIRQQLRNLVDGAHPRVQMNRPRLKASEFVAGNKEHMELLSSMGIRIATMLDGRIQLLHTASDALSPAYAEDGLKFMQEMIELSKLQKQESQHEPVYVKLLSPPPLNGEKAFRAGPAQFGYNLNGNTPVSGHVIVAQPIKGCNNIDNRYDMLGKIAVMERGECMFVEKARHIQKIGAIGGIVIDSSLGTSSDQLSLFAMSGDGTNDINIPVVFLFHKQGQQLLEYLQMYPDLKVELTCEEMEDEDDVDPISSEESGLPSSSSSTTSSDSSSTTSSPDSPPSSSSPSLSSSSTESTTTLTKAEHGFYHNELLDPTQRVYLMQGGTKFFHINIEVSLKSRTEEDEELYPSGPITRPSDPDSPNRPLFKYEPLPDNSKMFSFYLTHPLRENAHVEKPNLNQIYLDIIEALQRETNLEKLPRVSEYVKAIARLLESAYFELDRIDKMALDYLFNFVQEVKVKVLYPDGKERIVGDGHEHVNAESRTEEKVKVTVLPQGHGGDNITPQASSGIKIKVKSASDGTYNTFVEGPGDSSPSSSRIKSDTNNKQFDDRREGERAGNPGTLPLSTGEDGQGGQVDSGEGTVLQQDSSHISPTGDIGVKDILDNDNQEEHRGNREQQDEKVPIPSPSSSSSSTSSLEEKDTPEHRKDEL